MKIFLNFLSWFISLFLIFISLCFISDKTDLLLGLFFLSLGISLIPQIKNIINKKISQILTVIHKNQDNTNDKKFNNEIGIIKTIIFCLFFIIIAIHLPQPQTTNIDTSNTLKNEKVTENNYINDKNAKKILKATKLDKKMASKAYAILVNCGVSDISWIEKFDAMDNAYFIHIENISEPIKVSFKNNEIDYIFYDTWNLYKEGKYDGKLSDYSVTINDKFYLKKLSKDNINMILKYPKNSKYNENSWKISKFYNEYGVSCNVDAPNAFGMFTSYNFFLSYKKENGKFILVSMKCNGEELIQKQQTEKKLTSNDKKTIEDINIALGL